MRAVAIASACAIVLLYAIAVLSPAADIPHYYFLHQDRYVAAGLAGLLLASSAARNPTGARAVRDVQLDRRYVFVVAGVLALLLWVGTYVVFDNFPLTRDEHMVVFDMAVFRSGHLAMPLTPAWRAYSLALTPAFVLPLHGNVAWVSSYMPINAMLRTAIGTVADPALMNPLLVAIGLLALFDIGRRLFPENRSAQLVALVLYSTSAQVIVTAMTPYAMTMHLAFDLIWLSMYLRGSKAGHAAALAVGFLAIGIHQIVFHPLFVLPFIDHLRRRGEWRTAAIYVASYAVFILFWISYQHLVSLSAGAVGSSQAAAGAGGFMARRVIPLLVHRDPLTIPFTAENILRFITWQNLALVPLMGLSLGALRRDDGIARPLFYGVLLTIVALAILLPYQGHGWGYRYMAGVIGNCVLLGAYGWKDFSDRSEVRTFVSTATLATVCASLPFLLWQAHAFVQPYARFDQMLSGLKADMVIVDTKGTLYALDEVRNLPDLSNRPIRLDAGRLAANDIRLLCGRGTLAFVGRRLTQAAGVTQVDGAQPQHFGTLVSAAEHDCPNQVVSIEQ